MFTGKQRHCGHIQTITIDSVGRRHVVGAAKLVVVFAVARGHVHEACPLFGGNKVTCEQRHVELIAFAVPGMTARGPDKRRALHLDNDFVLDDSCDLEQFRQQSLGHSKTFANPRSTFFTDRRNFNHRVVDVGAKGDGAIARQRPRRCRPG